MSRKTLFKGKRIDNGEWVEGFYVKCRGHHYILPVYDEDHGFDERYADWIEVDPETVCQYTGLTDESGRKIFEGDILQIETENLTKDDGYFTVEWSESGCCFVLCGNKYLAHFDNVYKDFREVIGNIFDNLELLKGGQQSDPHNT